MEGISKRTVPKPQVSMSTYVYIMSIFEKKGNSLLIPQLNKDVTIVGKGQENLDLHSELTVLGDKRIMIVPPLL